MDAKRRYVYSIQDELADEFGPLFEAPTDAVALRQFQHLISQVDAFSRKDYKLFKFGSFEQVEGSAFIEAIETPEEVSVKEIIDAE
jgi:hypothetical protein